MKKLLLFCVLLNVCSIDAHDCFDSVKKQFLNLEIFPSDYIVEMNSDKAYTISSDMFLSDFTYNPEYIELTDPKYKAFLAKSEAVGCYGTEYIIFDETSCNLVAAGGGYCE